MKRLVPLVILLTLALVRSVSVSPTSQVHKIFLPVIAVSSSKYSAWALTWKNIGIPIQVIGMDARQEKQLTCSAQEAVDFAVLHPGKLYIACDEPEIPAPWKHWSDATGYAIWYHDFVSAVSAVDSTARFSPAGFSQNGIGYAQRFYSETARLYGTPPLVSEWRFHAFICSPRDIGWWKHNVHEASVWSKSHGAPMVLGSFGMPCHTPNSDITSTMKEMRDFINADPNIIQAVWWSADWFDWEHTLTNRDGSLSQEGKLYIQWR